MHHEYIRITVLPRMKKQLITNIIAINPDFREQIAIFNKEYKCLILAQKQFLTKNIS